MAAVVRVVLDGTDESRTVPVEPKLTFGGLARAVGDGWGLAEGTVRLRDADGCSWPAGEEVAGWLSQLPDESIHVRGERREEDDGEEGGEDAAWDAVLPEGGHDEESEDAAKQQQQQHHQDKQRLHRGTRRRPRVRLQKGPAGADGARRLHALSPHTVVLDELWRVFTFYCTAGTYSGAADSIRGNQFFRLLQDCGVIGTHASRTHADLAFVGQARSAEERALRRSGRSPPASSVRLHFSGFLGALMAVAARFVPRSRGEPARRWTPPRALFELLHGSVLPRARRWERDGVDTLLQDAEVEAVFERFRPFLVLLFRTYSSNHRHMSYAQFSHLAADLALQDLAQVTVGEVCHAFLASMPPLDAAASPGAAQLAPRAAVSLPEFVETLGRCALAGYSKTSDASVADMVRALFTHISHSPCFSAPSRGARVVRDCRSVLARELHSAFQVMWLADGRRDYLASSAGGRSAGARMRQLREAREARAGEAGAGEGGGERPATAAQQAAEAIRKQAEALVLAVERRNAGAVETAPPAGGWSSAPAHHTLPSPRAAAAATRCVGGTADDEKWDWTPTLEPITKRQAALPAEERRPRAAPSPRSHTHRAAKQKEEEEDDDDKFMLQPAPAAAGSPRRRPLPSEYRAAAGTAPAERGRPDSPRSTPADVIACSPTGGAGGADRPGPAADLSEAATRRIREAVEALGEAERNKRDVAELRRRLEAEREENDRRFREHAAEAEAKAGESRRLAEEGARERTAQEMDERARRGEFFVKYSRKAKAMPRFVALSADGGHLLWADSAAAVHRAAASGGGCSRLALSDVVEVLAGHQTPVFAKLPAQRSLELAPRSLSLVTAKRSIDLVATTAASRDAWLAFFQRRVQ